jgi:hypothetical protein
LIEKTSRDDFDYPEALTAIGMASSIIREGTFCVDIFASKSAGLGVK